MRIRCQENYETGLIRNGPDVMFSVVRVGLALAHISGRDHFA
jgi:hypothetical protein